LNLKLILAWPLALRGSSSTARAERVGAAAGGTPSQDGTGTQAGSCQCRPGALAPVQWATGTATLAVAVAPPGGAGAAAAAARPGPLPVPLAVSIDPPIETGLPLAVGTQATVVLVPH